MSKCGGATSTNHLYKEWLHSRRAIPSQTRKQGDPRVDNLRRAIPSQTCKQGDPRVDNLRRAIPSQGHKQGNSRGRTDLRRAIPSQEESMNDENEENRQRLEVKDTMEVLKFRWDQNFSLYGGLYFK